MARAADPAFDARRQVVIEETASSPVDSLPAEPSDVRVREHAAQVVSLDVRAAAAGSVVLLDAVYPGWHALVDGNELPIRRANGACRAVPVPAGAHALRFEYRPASFRLGVALFMGAAIAVAWLLWRGRRG